MSLKIDIDCGADVTCDIPNSIFRHNREKIIERMLTPEVPKHSLIVVHGGKDTSRADCDFEPLFRQESNFYYMFGAKEPGCMGIIELDTKKSILLVPHLPDSYAVWMGEIKPPSYFKELYGVDECRYTEEIDSIVSAYDPEIVYLNRGRNSDSGNYAEPAKWAGDEKYRVDLGKLYPVLHECRCFKTEEELKVYRYCNRKCAEAHMYVMANCKPGMYEFQLESIFRFATYMRGGCRSIAFVPIAASGPNSSTLHYGHAGAPNDRLIKDGDMTLIDMGIEYKCFTSDITRSYPANGKFTDDQKIIYEAVLDMQMSVIHSLKPGIAWPDMHRLAYKVGLTHLRDAGLLVGDVDEMIEADIGHIFMPHGLGHFMGHDTHDVGGYTKTVTRLTKPGFSSLRTAKVLEPGMVITVEPGIYFVKHLLEKAKANPAQAKFLNIPVLERFEQFGGVRIEDDVLITADGYEDLTVCPKSVHDVEAVMAGRITKIEELEKL